MRFFHRHEGHRQHAGDYPAWPPVAAGGRVGLTLVQGTILDVVEVEEPISAAAYEMEINAIGTGMRILKYLHISKRLRP